MDYTSFLDVVTIIMKQVLVLNCGYEFIAKEYLHRIVILFALQVIQMLQWTKLYRILPVLWTPLCLTLTAWRVCSMLV